MDQFLNKITTSFLQTWKSFYELRPLVRLYSLTLNAFYYGNVSKKLKKNLKNIFLTSLKHRFLNIDFKNLNKNSCDTLLQNLQSVRIFHTFVNVFSFYSIQIQKIMQEKVSFLTIIKPANVLNIRFSFFCFTQ